MKIFHLGTFFYPILYINFPLKFILLFYENHRQFFTHKIKKKLILKSSGYKHSNRKKTAATVSLDLSLPRRERREKSVTVYTTVTSDDLVSYIPGRKRNSECVRIRHGTYLNCVSSGRMKEDRRTGLCMAVYSGIGRRTDKG